MKKKLYIIGAVPLSLSILLSGCGGGNVENAPASEQAEKTEETKPELPVPGETADHEYTGISEKVVWKDKQDIETVLSVDAYSFNFTEVGTVEYTDQVRPQEGVVLRALKFSTKKSESFNSAELSSSAYFESKWDDKLTANWVDLHGDIESGYLIIASKEDSKNVRLLAHSSEQEGEPQEFSMETGESLTPDIGKAFYREHAGFFGEASDMKVKDKTKKVSSSDGEVHGVSANYSHKKGNKVIISVELNGPKADTSSSSDESLTTESREYVLIDSDGKEVKTTTEDRFDNSFDFPVDTVDDEYKLRVKLKGTVRNAATGAELGENWSATYEWNIKMLSDY